MSNTETNTTAAAIVQKCLKHCQSRIDDVAAAIQLRGGKKPVAPKKPAGKPIKKLSSEKQDIETLSEQQAWLRKNIAEINQKFGANTAFAKKIRAEMEETLERIDNLLESTLSSSTFTDSLMSPKLRENAKKVESVVRRVLGKRFASSTIAPIDHSAADGKGYSTILITFKNVKAEDRVMPWLVFAVSETQERQIDKRRRYLTAMSTPSAAFTPRSEFKDLKQLERLIQMYLTAKNITVEEKTANTLENFSLKGVIPGVTASTTKDGKITVRVEPKQDPKKVAVEGAKAIMSHMKQQDPNFGGNVQYTIKAGDKTKPHYITFVSTITAKDRKVNDKKSFFRVEEAKVETPAVETKDTAALIDIDVFFAQLGKMSKAMLGAKNFVIDKKNNSFKFSIGSNPKRVTHIQVSLKQDLYDIQFMKFSSKTLEMKTVYSEDSVQAAQAGEAIYRGTGLYTSIR